MLKILGILIVISVCAYLGFLEKRNLAERRNQLQALVFAVHNMANEISYGREPMNVILNNIAKNNKGVVSEFLFSVADDLSKTDGKVLTEVWQENLQKYKENMSLDESDCRVLKEFGCGLGISHTEDQLRKIAVSASHLEQQLVLAKENYLRLGKVFQTSGWCLGLVLVLLFA
ncbi:MAG: hypothetical protein ACOX7J_02920 [Bacillota bacterium]|jgi:stage III sporulation protein AB